MLAHVPCKKTPGRGQLSSFVLLAHLEIGWLRMWRLRSANGGEQTILVASLILVMLGLFRPCVLAPWHPSRANSPPCAHNWPSEGLRSGGTLFRMAISNHTRQTPATLAEPQGLGGKEDKAGSAVGGLERDKRGGGSKDHWRTLLQR